MRKSSHVFDLYPDSFRDEEGRRTIFATLVDYDSTILCPLLIFLHISLLVRARHNFLFFVVDVSFWYLFLVRLLCRILCHSFHRSKDERRRKMIPAREVHWDRELQDIVVGMGTEIVSRDERSDGSNLQKNSYEDGEKEGIRKSSRRHEDAVDQKGIIHWSIRIDVHCVKSWMLGMNSEIGRPYPSYFRRL